MLQIRYARKHEEVELRKAFDQIDFKRDDMIDAEELEQLFDMMGHKPPGVKVRYERARAGSGGPARRRQAAMLMAGRGVPMRPWMRRDRVFLGNGALADTDFRRPCWLRHAVASGGGHHLGGR